MRLARWRAAACLLGLGVAAPAGAEEFPAYWAAFRLLVASEKAHGLTPARDRLDCIRLGPDAPASSTLQASVVCQTEDTCGHVALGGAGAKVFTFGLGLKFDAACPEAQSRERQAAFEDAYLACGEASPAARARLQAHPFDLGRLTPEAKAQADIVADCPAMHGFRRVYQVDGSPREDLVFTLLPAAPQ